MGRKFTQEIPKKRNWGADVNQQFLNLDEPLQAVDNEIKEARDGYTKLKNKLDAMDSATDSVRNEVVQARGNYNNLNLRLDNSDSKLNNYTTEVSSARGSRSKLTDRLSVFLDSYGNPKLSQIVTQFADLGDSWTLVSATQIKTVGNQTGKYLPAFHVLVTDSEGDKYCQIDSVSYDAAADYTTLTMTNASPALSGTISKVKLAIISLDFGLVESVGQLFKCIFDLYNRVTFLEGKI